MCEHVESTTKPGKKRSIEKRHVGRPSKGSMQSARVRELAAFRLHSVLFGKLGLNCLPGKYPSLSTQDLLV